MWMLPGLRDQEHGDAWNRKVNLRGLGGIPDQDCTVYMDRQQVEPLALLDEQWCVERRCDTDGKDPELLCSAKPLLGTAPLLSSGCRSLTGCVAVSPEQ